MNESNSTTYSAKESARNALVEQLYVEYYSDLLRLCRRHACGRMANFVEDCIQEVFVTALEQYDKLLSHANVHAWLIRTAYNKMHNKQYEQQCEIRSISALLYQNAFAGINPYIRIDIWMRKQEIHAKIRKIYIKLSYSQKVLFREYFMKSRSVSELSCTWRITESSVRSRIFRLRKYIKLNTES